MFVLGHLGIGSRLAALLPAVAREPLWLMLGTLLPDLLDKPLYYGLALATGKRAAELGLISGTRTLGHTALLGLLLLALLAASGRVLAGRALLAGLATHWLLDLCGEPASALLLRLGFLPPVPQTLGPGTLAAILYPLLGPHFPVMPFKDFAEHASALRNLYTLGGEAVGALLLWRLFRKPTAQWRARLRGEAAATRAGPPTGAPGR